MTIRSLLEHVGVEGIEDSIIRVGGKPVRGERSRWLRRRVVRFFRRAVR